MGAAMPSVAGGLVSSSGLGALSSQALKTPAATKRVIADIVFIELSFIAGDAYRLQVFRLIDSTVMTRSCQLQLLVIRCNGVDRYSLYEARSTCAISTGSDLQFLQPYSLSLFCFDVSLGNKSSRAPSIGFGLLGSEGSIGSAGY